jgi:hypothetical protein
MKLFGREPAFWLALLASLLQALTAFGLDVDGQLQAIITAIVTAVFGIITAVMVGDGIIAAATGLAQAFISLFLYFGLDWSAEDQTKVLAFLTLALGLWVRDKVTAPRPATVSPPGKLVA